jgi:catechol 2,3-dioxygenase-like lactoylglutathione lyase family enzyme
MADVVTPIRFAHVVFRTAQFEAMKRWYETVLGAHVVHANPMLAFLTYDDEHHRIALVNMPGSPPRPEGSAGVEHFAYTYATLGDLVATYERLKSAGITPYWTINHGPTTSMYYRDPDGNQIELQVDNFPTAEELNAWFGSGAFARNPIGVDFDADELVRKFKAGVPVEELVRLAPESVMSRPVARDGKIAPLPLRYGSLHFGARTPAQAWKG